MICGEDMRLQLPGDRISFREEAGNQNPGGSLTNPPSNDRYPQAPECQLYIESFRAVGASIESVTLKYYANAKQGTVSP